MSDHTEIRIEAAGFTDVGPAREENQDAIILPGSICLGSESHAEWNGKTSQEAVSFAVIDGMGGYKGGKNAAALCATFLSTHHIPPSDGEATEMLKGLSRKIAHSGEARGTPRMGAAFAMLTFRDNEVSFINVGDCRIYCIWGNSMGQMTIDDRIDDNSPGITQAIGPTENPNAHFYTQVLRAGKLRYLLCSDGVWGTLGNERLKQLAMSSRHPGDGCSCILERLYQLESSDNCSLIIVDIDTENVGANTISQSKLDSHSM
ncbi:putative protein serine/threonine phosphatase [Slackia heliotrinireducens]|uniref:Serine/threonine protein phosphatase n=1 Tax=Slackia heliotrinireducens (strain ATCC 29202 / DSM 20476 / NCTC 11029 / RHS 1) TaxID=471855 RepID=C7N2A7_SLAHD|nr:protein phosphatase 2C domain-containing protein [Slackia heliotrinireducens]ACV21413.1 serine/threonine protein phosphatase [Slackia heliotrinireducens DSM 20476]VEG98850.1 putative protein serine/threonine phosphatase [Slackia heliotrinireducens]